ncbi:MAG TPA: MFS transporter [Candidatus Acidoferrales bacterium]|nr:MFS transporter [Candidatus Acidoferrales bacterium]
MEFDGGTNATIEPETKGWKFAVGSGLLGWVLDAFDFFVVVFLFDTVAAPLHVSKASVVYTLTLTLAMRPLGALFFGALADRFGRKLPLIFCVLYFSCCTVLTGLSPNFWSLSSFAPCSSMGAARSPWRPETARTPQW